MMESTAVTAAGAVDTEVVFEPMFHFSAMIVANDEQPVCGESLTH
jgi:hypothetical protein